MRIRNYKIRNIAKYCFYGVLCLTVILGIILIGWQINKMIEIYYTKISKRIRWIIEFKFRHYFLFQISRLIFLFILAITVFGFLISIGYYLRKFYKRNKGIYYKKVIKMKNS